VLCHLENYNVVFLKVFRSCNYVCNNSGLVLAINSGAASISNDLSRQKVIDNFQGVHPFLCIIPTGLSCLFDLFNLPIIIADTNFEIQSINKNCSKLLGIEPGQVSAKNFKNFFTSEEDKSIGDKIVRELQKEGTWCGRIKNSFQGKKEILVDVYAILLKNGKNKKNVFCFSPAKDNLNISCIVNTIELLTSTLLSFSKGILYFYNPNKKDIALLGYGLEELLGYSKDLLEKNSDVLNILVNKTDRNELLKKFKEFEISDIYNSFQHEIQLKCNNQQWSAFNNYFAAIPIEQHSGKNIIFGYFEKLEKKEKDCSFEKETESYKTLLSDKEKIEEVFIEQKELYNSLVESSFDAVFLSKGRRLLLVNSVWLKMFGYTEEEIYNSSFDIIKIVAPSDRPKIFEKFEKDTKEFSRYEMQGITKSGDLIDIEVSIRMIKWKGEFVYQGIYRNISGKKLSEISDENKNKLFESVAEATQQFLIQPGIEKAVYSSLEIIGSAAGLNKINIFENYDEKATNEHFMHCKYEWTDRKISSKTKNKELQTLSYKKFIGWYSQLSTGLVIKGIRDEFPDSIREFLQEDKIRSILAAPIFVKHKLWGFISFNDCKNEKIWNKAEVSAFATIANTIGNVFSKLLTEHSLKESEERYRFIFDQAADLIITLDPEFRIIGMNKKIELETGWKQEDLVGKNIFHSEILTSDTRQDLKNNIGEFTKDALFEIEINKKGGAVIPCELNAVPIYDSDELINIQLIIKNIKERKENERYLKESEEKYRNIFENIQDIFFQTDIHGKIITISPSIERYSGYKPDELVGKKVINFYATPRDRAKLMKEMQERGEVTDFIIRLRNKESKTVYVSVNSHTLRNKYQEIVGVEGSLRDVTEREIAYDEVRKLSRAVEQSASTVMITDALGKIVYVNPKFTVSTGYHPLEVIGKSSNILKSGEMKYEQYSNLWKTITAGQEWKGEFHNKKKNGELFWESASLSPIKNETGEITHYLAVKEDITEKKNQEKKLLKFQNLLKGVAESVQLLISEKDFNNGIKRALEALGKGSGADRVYVFENCDDVIRNNSFMNLKYEWNRDKTYPSIDSDYINSFSNDGDISSVLQNIEKERTCHVLTRKSSEDENDYLNKYGTISVLIVPIYIEKQFWGFIGFDNCQSEEKWSESEESILTAAAASIGRSIEREKTNTELIRAKEEAEKAERLKSEFLAQISHEIRSPLNVLLNYSQLFKQIIGDKIDPEIFQGFDGMENAGNRIIRTIDLLLNISELQTGSYSFRPKSIDIYSQVILPLFNEYKKLARGKNLIFNTIRHTDNTTINGDEYSIVQVFANLIDNAIKYTNEGKIEIFIDRNFSNKLFVKVADSGIGISENYLPQIYSPFSQEEQGYTRSYEGNGLGLALVKKYCEINNIDIFVDSIKSKGTTFTLIFNS
jgi:PAS domain S-box-containing protein